MAISRWWPRNAPGLLAFAPQVDIGLHLTLTRLPPLGKMPRLAPTGELPAFSKLLWLLGSGQICTNEIRDELSRQLDAFEGKMGFLPAFLDGHEHVHQLPVIRSLVLSLLRERFAGSPAYVRVAADSLPRILRRRTGVFRELAIASGALGFRNRARRTQVSFNVAFAGIYNFKGRTPYGELFERFLDSAPDGTLLICHPGYAEAADELSDRRVEEYQFLKSQAFSDSLVRHRARLVRGNGSGVAGRVSEEAFR